MNSEIDYSDIDLSDTFANLSTGENVNRQYQYLHQIGKGGFGTVYLASDPNDGSYKAIKEIQVNNMDPHKINEAEKEASLLEELDHPNILRCVDFFFTPAPAAVSLVLEYCEKGTMSSFLKQSGQLPTVLVHKWTNQLLSALQYLHSEGIIHRDLKPDNILITNNNDVKIADFGLAKIMDAVMPEEYDNYFFGNAEYAQTACGTKNYMAPEVWNKHYDDRSDVFSLGLILYVMLTHRKVSHANYLGVTLVPHEYIGITLGQDPSKLRKLFTESQWRKADFIPLRDLVSLMLTVDYQQRPRSSELVYRPNMVAKSGSTGSFKKLAVGSVALVAGLALGFMFTQTPDEDINEQIEEEEEVEDDEQSDIDGSFYSNDDDTDRNLSSSYSEEDSESLSESEDTDVEEDEVDDDEEEQDL